MDRVRKAQKELDEARWRLKSIQSRFNPICDEYVRGKPYENLFTDKGINEALTAKEGFDDTIASLEDAIDELDCAITKERKFKK